MQMGGDIDCPCCNLKNTLQEIFGSRPEVRLCYSGWQQNYVFEIFSSKHIRHRCSQCRVPLASNPRVRTLGLAARRPTRWPSPVRATRPPRALRPPPPRAWSASTRRRAAPPPARRATSECLCKWFKIVDGKIMGAAAVVKMMVGN